MRAFQALILALAVAGPVSTQGAAEASRSVAEHNKTTAIAYWNTLNTQGWDAASRYRGPGFRERSGASPSGIAELRAYYNALNKTQPRHYSVIVRAFAQGDLVFLHVHDIAAPGDFGTALMCFLRFKNGKIIEQWTAKQAVPGVRNFNGMF